jgi:hypothetical protein
MSADEPDIDDAVGIVDPDYDTIFVAGDIEDDATILENNLFTIDLKWLSRLAAHLSPWYEDSLNYRYEGHGIARRP